MARGRGFDPEAVLRRHFKEELARERAADAAREIPAEPFLPAIGIGQQCQVPSRAASSDRGLRLTDLAAAAALLILLGTAAIFDSHAPETAKGGWDSVGIDAMESFLGDCGAALGRAAEDFSTAGEGRIPMPRRFK